MKKHNKILSLLFASSLVFGGLASCGESNDTDKNPDTNIPGGGDTGGETGGETEVTKYGKVTITKPAEVKTLTATNSTVTPTEDGYPFDTILTLTAELTDAAKETHELGKFVVDGVEIDGNTFKVTKETHTVTVVVTVKEVEETKYGKISYSKSDLVKTLTASSDTVTPTEDGYPYGTILTLTAELTDDAKLTHDLGKFTVDGVEIDGNTFKVSKDTHLISVNVTEKLTIKKLLSSEVGTTFTDIPVKSGLKYFEGQKIMFYDNTGMIENYKKHGDSRFEENTNYLLSGKVSSNKGQKQVSDLTFKPSTTEIKPLSETFIHGDNDNLTDEILNTQTQRHIKFIGKGEGDGWATKFNNKYIKLFGTNVALRNDTDYLIDGYYYGSATADGRSTYFVYVESEPTVVKHEATVNLPSDNSVTVDTFTDGVVKSGTRTFTVTIPTDKQIKSFKILENQTEISVSVTENPGVYEATLEDDKTYTVLVEFENIPEPTANLTLGEKITTLEDVVDGKVSAGEVNFIVDIPAEKQIKEFKIVDEAQKEVPTTSSEAGKYKATLEKDKSYTASVTFEDIPLIIEEATLTVSDGVTVSNLTGNKVKAGEQTIRVKVPTTHDLITLVLNDGDKDETLTLDTDNTVKYTFIKDKTYTITATFKELAKLVNSTTDDKGTVTIKDNNVGKYVGDKVTVTISSKEGFEIKKVTFNSTDITKEIVDGTAKELTLIGGNNVLVAEFTEKITKISTLMDVNVTADKKQRTIIGKYVATIDDNNLIVCDDTGYINVYRNKHDFKETTYKDKVIKVTGEFSTFNDNKQIKAESAPTIINDSTLELPTPTEIDTSIIQDNGSLKNGQHYVTLVGKFNNNKITEVNSNKEINIDKNGRTCDNGKFYIFEGIVFKEKLYLTKDPVLTTLKANKIVNTNKSEDLTINYPLDNEVQLIYEILPIMIEQTGLKYEITSGAEIAKVSEAGLVTITSEPTEKVTEVKVKVSLGEVFVDTTITVKKADKVTLTVTGNAVLDDDFILLKQPDSLEYVPSVAEYVGTTINAVITGKPHHSLSVKFNGQPLAEENGVYSFKLNETENTLDITYTMLGKETLNYTPLEDQDAFVYVEYYDDNEALQDYVPGTQYYVGTKFKVSALKDNYKTVVKFNNTELKPNAKGDYEFTIVEGNNDLVISFKEKIDDIKYVYNGDELTSHSKNGVITYTKGNLKFIWKENSGTAFALTKPEMRLYKGHTLEIISIDGTNITKVTFDHKKEGHTTNILVGEDSLASDWSYTPKTPVSSITFKMEEKVFMNGFTVSF